MNSYEENFSLTECVSAEGTRGTDDAFYQLMLIGGEAILKLLGMKDSGGYEAKAIVLKAKEVRPDIMAVPRVIGQQAREWVYIEFQGYRSEMIRYHLASKVTLSCAQNYYSGPVLAGIIFTDKEYQEAALPLELLSSDEAFSIKGHFKEIVLTGYSEEELLAIDLRLVLLAPFTVPRKSARAELIDRGTKWIATAYTAYPEHLHQDVFNVLALFLLNRFRDLSREEVIQMLNFDLAETKAGQEIFQEGIEKGRLEGIEKGIEKGRLEGLIEAIKLGIELKFGLNGLKLLPKIEKEKDITRLDTIKEAIKIVANIKDIEELLV